MSERRRPRRDQPHLSGRFCWPSLLARSLGESAARATAGGPTATAAAAAALPPLEQHLMSAFPVHSPLAVCAAFGGSCQLAWSRGQSQPQPQLTPNATRRVELGQRTVPEVSMRRQRRASRRPRQTNLVDCRTRSRAAEGGGRSGSGHDGEPTRASRREIPDTDKQAEHQPGELATPSTRCLTPRGTTNTF